MSIQSQISRIEAAKTNIAAAISAKGVTVAADADIGQMAALIAAISVMTVSYNSQNGDLAVSGDTVAYSTQNGNFTL